MVRLALWQWIALAAPIGTVILFLLFAAGYQIHEWHLSWIWAVFGLSFVGWRWLLVRWTRPAMAAVDELVAEIAASLPPEQTLSGDDAHSGQPADPNQQAETALQSILTAAQQDPPIWADWNIFWQRCLELISAIARIYKPNAKQPLLNIYIPQAYVLLRGTVDDLNEWMQRMAPVLNQVTIEQALQAYEVYQKFQPAARRALQAWRWARWLLNPIAAAANVATQGTRSKANQELLGNINQMAREAVLRNLARQAIALYSGALDASENTLPERPLPRLASSGSTATCPPAQSIQDLLIEAEPPAALATKPLQLLFLGRTGAGKSSLINALFGQPVAAVDPLPSTDQIQEYQWESPTGERLSLWDSPGYAQIGRSDFAVTLQAQAAQADLILLATPAMDPALQMDLDMLQLIAAADGAIATIPQLAVVTQVDRLRPLKEWQPPYDWRSGNQPKEVSIRAAVDYRAEMISSIPTWLPVSTIDAQPAWGIDELAMALLTLIGPAQQIRFARFLQNQEARAQAAVQLVDRYCLRLAGWPKAHWPIANQPGIAAFLQSPVRRYLGSLAQSSPSFAALLTTQIPIEQLPLVLGKVQMGYELYHLLTPPNLGFDLLALWPLLTDHRDRADRNAWAFGQTLIAYWTRSLPAASLMTHFEQTLQPPESML
jgi:uncharacterized protein